MRKDTQREREREIERRREENIHTYIERAKAFYFCRLNV